MSLLEHVPLKAVKDGEWYKIDCPICEAHFEIRADSFDKIIKRWGYIFCANAFCATRLYAVTAVVADALEARRALEG